MKIKRRSCPALVGRKEAARLLGLKPENLFRDVPEVPPPLQDRRIKGFVVSTGPLWPLAEIQELVKLRERQRERLREAAALRESTVRRQASKRKRARKRATR